MRTTPSVARGKQKEAANAARRAQYLSEHGETTLTTDATRLCDRLLASSTPLAMAETTEDLLAAICEGLAFASEHIRFAQASLHPPEDAAELPLLRHVNRSGQLELSREQLAPWESLLQCAFADAAPMIFNPCELPELAALHTALREANILSACILPFSPPSLEAHAALLLLCDEDEVFLHGALDTLTAYAQLAGALLIQSAERQRLNDYATFDHLTGLLNRRALAEILEREHVRAERYNRAYSVLFFDLDHFKSINSSYGHAVGDLALQHVARLVGKALREGDWLGRWGGEEFLCILPDTSEAKAERIAQRVREQLASQPLRAQENTVTLTLSIGVACFPQDGYDINTLLVHADAGLALAKGSGRNCVRRYNPTEAA